MQNKTPGQPICTLRAHTRKVDIPLSSLQIIYEDINDAFKAQVSHFSSY